VRSVTIGLRSDDRGADRYVRRVPALGQSEYDVELSACFLFSIHTTLQSLSGLSQDDIEDLIEADWMWISLDTDVLLESSWELESLKERVLPDEAR